MPKAITKINAVYNLLDAHVFAKVGDTELECKSLLTFLRAAYTELTTNQVAKIVLSVLYRSLFTFMIYQYKESHGGVKIPLTMYHLIEPDQLEVETIKLPAIFVKKGNYNHFKEALNWITNTLVGVKNGEERDSHKELFKTGLEVVDCAIRNLPSEQIFDLREPLAEITNLCLSMNPGYTAMTELT